MSDYICGVCGLPIDFAAGERFVPQPISGYRHAGDYCVKRLAADNARLARELALAHKRMEYVAGELQVEGMYNLADHLLQDDPALAGPTRTADQPDAALPTPDFLRRGKD